MMGLGMDEKLQQDKQAVQLMNLTAKCSAVFSYVLQDWGNHSEDAPCGAWQGILAPLLLPLPETKPPVPPPACSKPAPTRARKPPFPARLTRPQGPHGPG